MSDNRDRSDSQSSSRAAPSALSPATPTQSTIASAPPGACPQSPAAGTQGATQVCSPQTPQIPNEPSTTCSPSSPQSSAPLVARGALDAPLLPLPAGPSRWAHLINRQNYPTELPVSYDATMTREQNAELPHRTASQNYPTDLPVYFDAAMTQAEHVQSHEPVCDRLESLSLKGNQSQSPDSGRVQDPISVGQPLSSTSPAFHQSSSTAPQTQTATQTNAGVMPAADTQPAAPVLAAASQKLEVKQEMNCQNPSHMPSSCSEQESQMLTPGVIDWIVKKRIDFMNGISEGTIPIDHFRCQDDDGDTYAFIKFFRFGFRTRCQEKQN